MSKHPFLPWWFTQRSLPAFQIPFLSKQSIILPHAQNVPLHAQNVLGFSICLHWHWSCFCEPRLFTTDYLKHLPPFALLPALCSHTGHSSRTVPGSCTGLPACSIFPSSSYSSLPCGGDDSSLQPLSSPPQQPNHKPCQLQRKESLRSGPPGIQMTGEKNPPHLFRTSLSGAGLPEARKLLLLLIGEGGKLKIRQQWTPLTSRAKMSDCSIVCILIPLRLIHVWRLHSEHSRRTIQQLKC